MITASFQHTSLTHLTLASYLFGSLTVVIFAFLLACIVRPKIFYYFQSKLGEAGYLFPHALILLALAGGICGAQAMNTLHDMEKNLAANIKQVYDVDSVELQVKESETVSLWYETNYYAPEQDVKATVTKGDRIYHVTVEQDIKTYEPTLVSQDNMDLSGLKQNS